MTGKSVSKAFLLAVLIIVVSAPVFFHADSSLTGTAASKTQAGDLETDGFRKQENTTKPVWASWKRETPEQVSDPEPTKIPSIEENETDQKAKEEVEPAQTQEVAGGKVDPIQTPAPTGNSPSWGISTNRADLGVYSDSACTQTHLSMDLGTISPGGPMTKTLYVKNEGSNNLTLSLITKNWKPTIANGPVTLTWNLEGATLTVNQVSTATLTLSVSSTIQGITSFSFDVVISGTE